MGDKVNEPLKLRQAMILMKHYRAEIGRRDKVIASLRTFTEASVEQHLSSLLADPDSNIRCNAAEVLCRIRGKNAVELIIPLLSDDSADVRWHICGCLHSFGDQRALPDLINVLVGDPIPDVRLFAAWALGNIGDSHALPALRQAVSDDCSDDEGRCVGNAATKAIEMINARN